jgi:proteasome lid subunit RPN8/RPN11
MMNFMPDPTMFPTDSFLAQPPHESAQAIAPRVGITAEALRGIAADLVSAYPEEGCGFLLGSADPERVITAFLPVQNANEGQRERRFNIRPVDYLLAERWASEQGLDLIGIYHSHPEVAPVPSATDLASALPWFSYLITRVTAQGAQESRSWQLNADGVFEEEGLEKRNVGR